MQVPFVDLKQQNDSVAEEVNRQIEAVIRDSAFVKGRYVESFERNFADFCGAHHCIGVGNGTDALFIALKAIGLGPGDEVLVPVNTFIATAEAVSMAGARVVFVDCDSATYNININLIEEKITPRTKAIIPVHLYGQTADLAAIDKIAKKHDLKIVQDCAQAHGGGFAGKPFADYGNILCFSFYPGKNLGAYGDAGAVVTNDQELAKKALMIANHGRIEKYNHEFEGINSRMDGMQAAVLDIKLKYLPKWNKKRIKNADIYFDLLKVINHIDLPYTSQLSTHVYHLFVIRSKIRDLLKEFLSKAGISTGIHYPIALHNLKAYRYLGHKPEDFPIANQYQDEVLSLPMHPELNAASIQYVVQKIRRFFE